MANLGFIAKAIKALNNIFIKLGPAKRSTEVALTELPQSQTARMVNKARAEFRESAEIETRKDKYENYEYLDKSLAEANSALNIYGDNIVSGAIGGEENYKFLLQEDLPNAEKIEEIIGAAERRTGIKDYVWDIARNLTRDADNFEEVVLEEAEGAVRVQKLKRLPPAELFANVNEFGAFIDPLKPYYQKSEAYGNKKIEFDWWRIIHFKIGRAIYGVDNGLFAGASNRVGKQLLWVDEMLVMARITRAWQRYAFSVDTTGIAPDEKFDYLEAYRDRIRRKEVINRDTERINIVDANWWPDEDVFLPTDKDGGGTEVKILTGDMNVGNITDVKYLQTKFLMSVNVPKAYVSVEEGTRAKATLTQLDVQFARQVRRRQRALIPGLKQFYQIVLYLADIDPFSFKWDIVFPELATTDEMMKWEMLLVKAKIAEILVVKVGAVNDEFVLDVLLKLTDDEKAKYRSDLGIPEPGPGDGDTDWMNIPPDTAAMLRKDPQIRQLLGELKDLFAWKRARADAMKGMKEIESEEEKESEENETT